MGFVSKQCVCLACNAAFEHGKKLSLHIRKEHKLSPEEFVIKYMHGGNKPTCVCCDTTPRFVSLIEGYKRYCKEHSREAEVAAGKVGGKIKQTWNKGQTKQTDERIALLAIKQSGENNPFYGKQHSIETISKISISKLLSKDDFYTRISKRESEFELLTPLSEYTSRQQQYLKFKCKVCGEIQPKTLYAYERGSRCYICHPISKSNWELDVFAFVKSICDDAISGDRTILSPKEIDIYVPSKKFGIECHGLYWHSEGSKNVKDKRSHLFKTQSALEKGVQLLQLFEDEWRDKRSICESLIKHRLGATTTKLGARTLSVITLSADLRRQFFEKSHIAGDVPAMMSWALVDKNNVILAALSVRKPRHAQKYQNAIEIARFCVATDVSISGGLNRLIKQAITYARLNGYTQLLTYVDRRIGDGHGYKHCGFDLQGDTGVDYYYTDNFLRYDRFKFRAQNGISENDVAKNAGVSRIYGCGSYVFMKYT